jgi:hypothetical protein
VKKTLEKTISNNRIDQYYERALDAGALVVASYWELAAVALYFFTASRIIKSSCAMRWPTSPKS